jgi:aspartyl-tRNA(Asn)/glutamyl-tRNA(Gln) amidotransferase subunit A
MDALNRLSATALRRAYLSREASPVEVLRATAERLEETRGFNAFVTPLLDVAVQRARWAEDLYRRGLAAGLPLLGIPIAVKDNYDTAAARTTYGSSLFVEHVPVESAECVRRAEAAGAIVVGKTGLHEFAMGVTGENPHFGPCRNPWDPARITGGSSSGSAAAVALMAAPLALGSDTAGSIRIPAALCGVVGLKPTYDRLPRAGLFPLAPSLDHVGLLAREPNDLAVLLRALDDPPDRRTAAGRGLDERGLEDDPLFGLRVGILSPAALADVDEDVAAVVRAAALVLSSRGAQLTEVDAALFVHVLRSFVPIQQAEVSFVHRSRGLFPAHRAAYGEDVADRLDKAASISLDDYFAAAERRDRLKGAVRAAFATVDVMLTPAGGGRAPTFTALADPAAAAEFRRRTLLHTVPQSLTGVPSCVVRAGFDRDGLPLGVQLSAPVGTDERLLRVADAFVGATPAVQSSWPA